MTQDAPTPLLRQHWMGVLARASLSDLTVAASTITDLPEGEIVRAPEVGTVMVEGRAGGTGRRFNLGEATVTRAVIRVGDRLGFAYGLGRDRAKILLAARLDAALQDAGRQAELIDRVITPLAATESARRDLASRKAAATKVEFFTMVRGD